MSSLPTIAFTSKVLKTFWKAAKGSPSELFSLLITNREEIDLQAEDYKELSLPLDSVNRNQSLVKETAPKVLEFVGNAKTNQELVKQAGTNKGDVAEFLVEALRCVNFAEHKSAYVAQFVKLIRDCGIPIDGDIDQCIKLATFGTLQYNTSTQKIVVSVT